MIPKYYFKAEELEPTITEVESPFNIPDDSTKEYVGQCAKCGLKLARVMMYCCPNSGCPSGLGSKATL